MRTSLSNGNGEAWPLGSVLIAPLLKLTKFFAFFVFIGVHRGYHSLRIRVYCLTNSEQKFAVIAFYPDLHPAPWISFYLHVQNALYERRDGSTVPIPITYGEDFYHEGLATNPASPWLYQTSPNLTSPAGPPNIPPGQSLLHQRRVLESSLHN
jgi:hypothetical protein